MPHNELEVVLHHSSGDKCIMYESNLDGVHIPKKLLNEMFR